MINASFDGSFAVTNTGASRKNDLLAYGRAFKLKYFQAGGGGHDASTNLPLSVDVTLTSLPKPTTGLIEFTNGSIVPVDYRSSQVTITLGKGVATGVLSNIAIWGEIVSVADPADSALIGGQFIYAICNLGFSQKASNSTRKLSLLLHSI